MPRPRKRRQVGAEPGITYFKPRGVPASSLDEVVLTVEEYEALRLADLDGLSQEDAAEKMGISQPTFHRLLTSARHKLSDSIINGKAIRIEGGDYMVVGRGQGMGQGRGLGRGGGQGRMGGSSLGPGGECVCPKCGTKISHPRGTPCFKMKCPKCGTQMTR